LQKKKKRIPRIKIINRRINNLETSNKEKFKTALIRALTIFAITMIAKGITLLINSIAIDDLLNHLFSSSDFNLPEVIASISGGMLSAFKQQRS
jgi:hypothetical protein